MLKPNDYENVQAYGEFESLKTGGHVCRIMKVEETKSQSRKPMVRIYLDIAEGEQAGYFAARYDADTRKEKKWGCIVYQLIYDNEGGTNRGFKTFTTSVKESNAGFEVAWSDNPVVFEGCFKDKLVGGVFGREQYQGSDGKLRWSVKCRSFRSVDAIRKGVPVPEDKYLEGGKDEFRQEGFTPFNSFSENDLPF